MAKFSEDDVYIFNKERECMQREDMKELQLKRLKNTVKYAYEHVDFYRDLYDKHNVHPDDIKTLEDIQKLPFIT